MTQERKIEVYQAGYKVGHTKGLEFVKNNNQRIIQPKQNLKELRDPDYIPEEVKLWKNAYCAGYTYAKRYPNKEINL